MIPQPRQEILPPVPRFAIGDRVRVTALPTIAIARVPNYLRGCRGVVERLVDPLVVEDNRGRGREIQSFQHYRIVVPLSDLWPNYTGSPRDDLHLEICEPWLERLG
jgi:nitrile hydratase subunit beta